MPNLSRELDDLVRADDLIAQAVDRCGRQRNLVAELECDGHDTRQAQRLLETMEAVLQTFEQHRDTIIEAVAAAQLEAERRGRAGSGG
jgi:hypothetical protein